MISDFRLVNATVQFAKLVRSYISTLSLFLPIRGYFFEEPLQMIGSVPEDRSELVARAHIRRFPLTILISEKHQEGLPEIILLLLLLRDRSLPPKARGQLSG